MTQNSERGQILIIFTIVLVVLLGFASLAVDVGMIYGDRRYNQSIADTASMAGAGSAAQYLEKNGITWTNFSCDNSFVTNSFTTAYDSARSRATNNLVGNLDNNISDNHGIEVTCLNDADHFDKHIDVHTKVTSKVPTTFMHFFFDGEVKNTVNAVTRIRPRTQFAFGHAIVSLSEACGTNTGGITFDGTSDVKVTGGGVFSNSCINASGSVSVDIISGGIDYFSSYTANGHPVLSPAPVNIPARMPIQEIDTPSCGAGAAQSRTSGGTISPGNYSLIKTTNGDSPLVLNPGLYCLTGDLEVSGSISGDGVTFYMKNNSNMKITGGGDVHLNAPTVATATGGAVANFLVIMANGNTGNCSLEGNSSSSYGGIIYGRDASIDIGGTSGTETPTNFSTQLIAKVVKVHGTAKIDIKYNNMEPSTKKPKLDLME